MKKLLLLVVLLSAVVVFAQAPSKEDAQKALEVIKSLNPQWGQVTFEFDKVEVSPLPNYYQARFYVAQQDKQIPVVLYISKDGKFAIIGQIIDTQAKKNLTQDFAGDVKYPPTDMSKVDLKNGAIMGDLNAPVKIIEYSDFQCPFCKRAIPTVKEVLKNYGKDVVLIFKCLPLPMHNLSKPMAIAALCGAQQRPDAFWNFHDTFFSEQFTATDADSLKAKVIEIAKTAKLDVAKFTDCFTNNKTEAQVTSQSNEANALGIQSTPTFVINGQKVPGALPYENFKSIIDEKLKEKGAPATAAPKKEAPKKEAPKKEAPKKEAPKAEDVKK
jgi:protein-disulfide isomerase